LDFIHPTNKEKIFEKKCSATKYTKRPVANVLSEVGSRGLTVITGSEESSLLEAATKQRLVKTQQAEKT
jgi:hypothetical protein